VALRNALGHHLAHEVVVHHLVDAVALGRGLRQRHIQLHIDPQPLRRGLLEVVDADLHQHLVTAQEQLAAVQQQGI